MALHSWPIIFKYAYQNMGVIIELFTIKIPKRYLFRTIKRLGMNNCIFISIVAIIFFYIYPIFLCLFHLIFLYFVEPRR